MSPSPTIDEVRQAMREKATREDWFPVYEAALADAYERNDVRNAAELALLAAVRLWVSGSFDDAVAQADYGIRIASAEVDQLAHLHSFRASMLALQGDVASARESIGTAAKLVTGSAPTSRPHLEHETYASMVSAILLEDLEPEQLEEPLREAERAGLPWLSSGAMVWVIPWLVSIGLARDAGPRVDALLIQSRAERHTWRLEDAETFLYALDATSAVRPASDRLPPDMRNPMARWRAAAINLRRAILISDWTRAAHALSSMSQLRSELCGGFHDGARGYDAIVSAYRDDSSLPEAMPPSSLTVNNLGEVLAAIEAVAIAGSQDQAVAWYRWTRRYLPTHVRTSLEWPVSVDRVLALLASRVGVTRTAIRHGRRALRWANASGYVIEAAIAQVQLAEFIALASPETDERQWLNLRRDGRGVLTGLGIDPVPHAYAATRSLALGLRSDGGVRLTPREVEVLSLLADGFSYRQSAERLGVEWRTVQTHARNIYEKLGVPGRVLAISKARDLEIL